MKHLFFFAATVALLAGTYSSHAGAVDVTRDVLSHGVANCQSALPVFDGQIRKRPKAFANEGASNAFVTCDFESNPNPTQKITNVGMHFISRNAAATNVSCTLVQGVGDINLAPAITKSVSLNQNAIGSIGWGPADNGGNNFTAAAVSCNLLPGVEISVTQFLFLENIGT